MSYTITITQTPQTDNGPLFSEPSGSIPPILDRQPPVEVARVTVGTLDVPALLALIYKTPRAKRSDSGKSRAAK
jgi:hypothetical protein